MIDVANIDCCFLFHNYCLTLKLIFLFLYLYIASPGYVIKIGSATLYVTLHNGQLLCNDVSMLCRVYFII